MAVHDVARIEERLDRTIANATPISDAIGGILFQNMAEVLEFSKLMSLADVAVPKHLRGNPGACLRIVTQALEWRMSPFAVADKSYSVGDKIAYESQLIHAVIEQRAPITGRLRHKFEGEGDERVCIVWAQVKGEADALEYRSPPFGKIQPKNSPLWKTKPDLQQYYNTSRDFCRIYFPDVLLGIYSEDELRDSPAYERAKDVTPKPTVGERLKNKGARGFSQQHVEQQTGGTADGPAEAAKEEEAPSISPDQADASPSALSIPSGEAEEGRVSEPVDAPLNLYASFASELFEAKDAKELKSATAAFWNSHIYPDDETEKARFDAIHKLHVRRIKGEIEPKALTEEIKELVVR